MALDEKILHMRKKIGWSQEELAEKCGVSRQSVSKWESGQSVPDLNKILILSDLFHVSTDYLLKDKTEEYDGTSKTEDGYPAQDETIKSRIITRSEAEAYLELVRESAPRIALGVLLCILSPVTVMLLGCFAEYHVFSITDHMAGGIGVTVLLILIAIAVSIFIPTGMRLGKYEYMEHEAFELEDGVAYELQRQNEEKSRHFAQKIAVGVILCILAVVPLMVAAALQATDITYCVLTGVLLAIISVGVYILVREGMLHGSYQILLQVGDYTRYNKKAGSLESKISSVYWPCVTAVYLGYSFLTANWGYSWIIWPIAGVSFAAIKGICRIIKNKQ